MSLSYYLGIFWRRKWIIIATTLITVIVVAFGTTRLPSTYVATSTLRISTVASGGSDYFQFDLLYSDRLMNTYAQMATSGPTLDSMLEAFNIPVEMLPLIAAEVIKDTELLTITVTDQDPVFARDAANFLAQALVDYNQSLFAVPEEPAPAAVAEPPAPRVFTTPLIAPEEVVAPRTQSANMDLGRSEAFVVAAATTPTEPQGINLMPFIVMSAMVGMIGGMTLVLVLHNLDTRVYSTDEIERIIRQPVLGEIPLVRRLGRKRILLDVDRCAEAFRWLLTNLLAIARENSLKTFTITSAEPEEGKSAITVSLAVSMAQSGLRVVVIDADLRRPTLHKTFEVDNNAGLSGVLRDQAPLDEVLQPAVFPGVTVLTSGSTLYVDPTQALSAERFAEVLEQLAEDFDLVLVDTPASLAVADTAMLAPLTDGVLVVVRHGHVQQSHLQSLRRQFDKVNAQVIGVVVNRSDKRPRYHKYYSSGGQSILKLMPGGPREPMGRDDTHPARPATNPGRTTTRSHVVQRPRKFSRSS